MKSKNNKNLLEIDELKKYHSIILKSKYRNLNEIKNFDFQKLRAELKCSIPVCLELINIFKILDSDDVLDLDDLELEDLELDEDNNFKKYNDIKIIDLDMSYKMKKYLINNSYNYVSELKDFNIEQLYYSEKIGIDSILEFRKIYYKYYPKKSKQVNYNIADLDLSVRCKNSLTDAGYTNVSEIIDFDLYDFIKLPRMGMKSAKEINEIVKQFNNNIYISDDKLIEFNLENSVYKNENIVKFTKYKYFDKIVSLLEFFGINPEITYLDFYNRMVDVNKQYILSKDNKETLFEFFNFYENTKHKINITKKLSDNYKFVINKRSEGLTLEDCGQVLNLTRERVRQIESKAKYYIEKEFENLRIEELMIDSIYTKKNTLNISDEEYSIFIENIDKIEGFIRINLKNSIWIGEKLYNEILNSVNELKSKILDVGYVLINEYNNKYDEEVFEFLANSQSIIKTSKVYYFKENKNSEIYSYIKNKIIVDFTEKNIKNVEKELKELFSYEEDMTSHKVCSRLDKIEDLILVSNYKYGYYKKIEKINPYIESEIIREINENILFDCKSFYLINKNKLPEFYTPTLLYKSIQKKYKDKYKFGGTNLYISKFDSEANKALLVYNYLNETTKPENFVDLYSKFNLDKRAIDVIVSQNEDIIYIDSNTIWLKSKIKDFDKILNVIKKYLNNNKTFFQRDINSYIYTNNNDLFNSNSLNTEERITKFMQMYSPDLKDYDYDRDRKLYKRKVIEVDIYDDAIEF